MRTANLSKKDVGDMWELLEEHVHYPKPSLTSREKWAVEDDLKDYRRIMTWPKRMSFACTRTTLLLQVDLKPAAA